MRKLLKIDYNSRVINLKKIGVFSTNISESMGGIDNMSYNLVVYLSKRCEVEGYSGPVKIEEKLNNVFYTNGKLLNIKGAIEVISKFAKSHKLKKFNYNLALTWKVGLLTYFIKILFKVPYVVYIHGNEIYPNKTGFLYKLLIKLVFKNASLIIANSEYTKKLSSYYGNDYNVKVIHPGVTFKESVKIDDYVDITKEGKSLILLSVGRLVKRKGIDNTIKSLKYLVKKYPNIKYIIAGKGNYEKELRKIIEENQLQDYVVLKGEVSEEEKNKLYEMCDLFLMPSYEIEKDGDVEGFGIVYLEANRHGKFVIAGNSGGISDAVINNKTGFIVDGTNPQEIAKAVDRFFTEVYGKKDYKRDCINWALEHDWNIIIDKLMEYIF